MEKRQPDNSGIFKKNPVNPVNPVKKRIGVEYVNISSCPQKSYKVFFDTEKIDIEGKSLWF